MAVIEDEINIRRSMPITKISDLVPGRNYWHLYIQDKSNWTISQKADLYKTEKNWKNMIVCETEDEAKCVAECLRKIIEPLMLH